MPMQMKKKASLLAITIGFAIVLLNVAPLMSSSIHGVESFSNANPSQSFFMPAVTALPNAYDDSYLIDEDTSLSVPAPGVLGNDISAAGGTLLAILDTGPVNGLLSLTSDGSFTYTPNSNFYGYDSFTYYADEDGAASNIATVTIMVTSVNDPPVAVDDAYTIDEDTFLVASYSGVLINDIDVEGDPLTTELVSSVLYGSLVIYPEGDFDYTPNPNWYGVDSFQYRIFDTHDYSNTATVTITVNSVNDVPVGTDDAFTIDQDTVLPLTIAELLSNDYDNDGDTLQFFIQTNPSSGTLSPLSAEEYIYTPNTGWYGIDSFTYRLFDGQEYSTAVQVTITVQRVIYDTTPPTTTISLDGILGDNGWYTSDVLVTLTATDDFSVATTMFSLDGILFFTYPGPLLISGDGLHTILYYSIDISNNIEPTQSAEVIIDTDTTGPIITIVYIGDGVDSNPGYWSVNVDDPESGIASVVVYIDGVPVGNSPGDYVVPNILGFHNISVSATNADVKMGVEDQESSTASLTTNIIDDDTTAPEITITYFGGITVEDAGNWTVAVLDPESGITTISVAIDGVLVGFTAGNYSVPDTQGTHNITVVAYNGDLDRGAADQEISETSASVTLTHMITPGFVTGGGWIYDETGNKGHFVFVVSLTPDGELAGMFMYTMKAGRYSYVVIGTEISDLYIDGNYAYFDVVCSIMIIRHQSCKILSIDDGYLVRVDIWENQCRRGRDIFQIRISDPSGQILYKAGFDPLGYVHGAIVIHEYRPIKCHPHPHHHGRR